MLMVTFFQVLIDIEITELFSRKLVCNAELMLTIGNQNNAQL
jgi:hypothetical protein